jgi:hypothetical protein
MNTESSIEKLGSWPTKVVSHGILGSSREHDACQYLNTLGFYQPRWAFDCWFVFHFGDPRVKVWEGEDV